MSLDKMQKFVSAMGAKGNLVLKAQEQKFALRFRITAQALLAAFVCGIETVAEDAKSTVKTLCEKGELWISLWVNPVTPALYLPEVSRAMVLIGGPTTQAGGIVLFHRANMATDGIRALFLTEEAREAAEKLGAEIAKATNVPDAFVGLDERIAEREISRSGREQRDSARAARQTAGRGFRGRDREIRGRSDEPAFQGRSTESPDIPGL